MLIMWEPGNECREVTPMVVKFLLSRLRWVVYKDHCYALLVNLHGYD